MVTITDNNIFSRFQELAEEDREAALFYFNGLPMNRGDALGRVRRLAGFFRDRGVERGDRIGIALGNVPEFVYSFLAAAQIGAVAVLVNPEHRRYELDHIINETIPAFFITARGQLVQLRINGREIIEREKIITVGENQDEGDFQSVLKKGAPFYGYEKLDPDETLAIIYTSAERGFPLGAMITHTGVSAITGELGKLIRPGDRFLSLLPFFHSFGLTTVFLLPLLCSCPFYITDRFTPDTMLDTLRKGEMTILIGVPLMFKIIAAFMRSGETLPRLRYAISGGEAMDVSLQEKLLNGNNINVRQGYGLTEASPIVTWNYRDDENRFGSVGLPMSWNEVLLPGVGASPGGNSEILVRGKNVFKGYYRRRDITGATMVDGWLSTGDTGYLDGDGYLYLAGSKKEMIIKNGLNIYPKEVERLISLHPGVRETRIRRVARKRDGVTLKEELEATVYTSGSALDEEELKNWCKENVAKYKIPRYFIIT